MPSKPKGINLLQNAGIYALANILQKAMGVFLLPIYTSYLSKSEIGITGVIAAIVPVLGIIYSMSIKSALTRLFFKYKESQPEIIPKIWGAATLLTILFTLSFAAITSILFYQWGHIWFPGVVFSPFLIWAIFTAVFQSIFTLYQTALQTQGQAKSFGLQQTFLFFLQTILCIIFVAFLDMGAEGVVSGIGIANGVLFVWSAIKFLPSVKLNLEKKFISEILRYSIPLVPHGLSAWAAAMINRLFLNNMINSAAAGLFQVGFQIANMLNLIAISINQAFGPWFFSKVESKKDNRDEIQKVGYELAIFYSIAALVLSLSSPFLISILTQSNFHSAWIAVPGLAYAFAFNGIYFLAVGPVFLYSSKKVPLITLSSSGIGLLANYFLIQKFGISGASWASTLSYFCSSFLAMIIGRKVYNVGYPWLKIYSFVFISLLLSLVTLQVQSKLILFSLAMLISLFYLLLKRNQIQQLIRSRKNKHA